MTAGEISRIRQLSHESMQRGIHHLSAGNPAMALAEFESAVELRELWPWLEDGELAWMLSAAWINRADALAGVTTSDRREEAIAALDRGLEVLAHVPAGATPALPGRLILAWIKRADLCAAVGKPDAAREAYAKAAALLAGDRGELAVMLATNRARFLLDHGRVREALVDARHAVSLCRQLEPSGASIIARVVLCRALACQLEEPEGLDPDHDWIAEATDAVEEAFALSARQRVESPALADLLRYGAKIYRICQPQFLGPFITEALRSSSDLRHDAALMREMRGDVLIAIAAVEDRMLRHAHEDDFVAKHLKILRSLQEAREKLPPAVEGEAW